MTIKTIVDEDLTNYKKPSMLIGTARCTFKCDEPNRQYCQNRPWAKQPDIIISNKEIIDRYLSNSLTQALIFAGLEPMDQFDEMMDLIKEFREKSNDDVVIYTGYTYSEVADKIVELTKIKNIVIKFGRYIPNNNTHYDDVLGVNLASDNQYAQRVS